MSLAAASLAFGQAYQLIRDVLRILHPVFLVEITGVGGAEFGIDRIIGRDILVRFIDESVIIGHGWMSAKPDDASDGRR